MNDCLHNVIRAMIVDPRIITEETDAVEVKRVAVDAERPEERGFAWRERRSPMNGKR